MSLFNFTAQGFQRRLQPVCDICMQNIGDDEYFYILSTECPNGRPSSDDRDYECKHVHMDCYEKSTENASVENETEQVAV